MTAYIDALNLHMKRLSPSMEDVCFDTVYVGGGTPGLLSPKLLKSLLETVRTSFHIDPQAEITIETNPAADAADTLIAAYEGGINRLSIGLQSVHDNELKTLGRLHRFAEFKETVAFARSIGFSNISADLMYGIPHQTLDSLLASIDVLASLDPQHISLYGLRVEEETPFGRMGDRLSLPEEDIQCDMYEKAVTRLAEHGYNRYEISNFSKIGYESRHNLRYWERSEYIGLGPGAHSYYNGVRYSYPRSLSAYIGAIEQGSEPPYDTCEPVTTKDAANERLMLGLRLERGIEVDQTLRTVCEPYLKNGFMWEKNGRIGFTTRGFLVSNTILSTIIE